MSLGFLPNIPILGSTFYDGCFAVLMLIVGGFIYGKADNKLGLPIMLVAIVWVLLVFQHVLRTT